MRYVVTGGAGFLGSHLCERLVSEGHEVVCLDNMLTGRAENVAHLPSDRFIVKEYDVTNFISIVGDVDAVLHLASPASPIDYLRFPIQTLKVGALGTHNTLGLAMAKGARYLLASTSEVYGDPLQHPQTEEYWGNVNPVGLRGVYDEAKRFAEAMTMAYHRYHSLNTCIARIFNSYGPRMRIDDGRAVPAFITAALKNEPIPVFGDGTQTRSFCYVDDTIGGLLALLGSGHHDPVNIGDPHEMTILEMAKLIIELTGSGSEIAFKPLPKDDPRTRRPDIARARELLGWAPKTPVEEGLRKTIDYIKGRLRAEG
ncbi:MAG: UDP-glucuronic acid decarboxylase family protein [bacterium]